MNTLIFNDREVAVIRAALEAVSPSGGGSEQFTLLHKIQDRTTHIKHDLNLVVSFCNNVINDAVEADVVQRLTTETDNG